MNDLRSIDLNLLVSLDALLDECNVTRASRRLHLSQSSLSAQLARLRVLLRDPLLIPASTGRGMTPTARALALAAPLRAVLKDLETVLSAQPSFDPLQDTRTFQIAASDSAVMDIGLSLMKSLNRSAGTGVRVAFRSPDMRLVTEQLESGEVDLLIGPAMFMPASTKRRGLFTEQFVLAQRKGHPRGIQALTLEEYCGLRHMLVSPSGGSFLGAVDEQLVKLGAHRQVVLSVQHFTLATAVLQATDYVSTLPARLLRHHLDSLDTLVLPFAMPTFEISMAWHPRNQLDPGAVWLRERVLEASRD